MLVTAQALRRACAVKETQISQVCQSSNQASAEPYKVMTD